MDITTLIGILIGLASIVAGIVMEGGSSMHMFQSTAAVIVFGGTLGATVVSFTLQDLVNAVRSLGIAFGGRINDPNETLKTILEVLVKARKDGVVSLESQTWKIENSFLRNGLNLIIDGLRPDMVKEILYQEIHTYEDRMKRAARVFAAAGGFAPTIGILGAVIGLIQVMNNVGDPSRIGSGIAESFVATIYGVGAANLLLIPIGKKIANRLKDEIFIRHIIIEGIVGIENGTNPYLLKARLSAFITEREI